MLERFIRAKDDFPVGSAENLIEYIRNKQQSGDGCTTIIYFSRMEIIENFTPLRRRFKVFIVFIIAIGFVPLTGAVIVAILRHAPFVLCALSFSFAFVFYLFCIARFANYFSQREKEKWNLTSDGLEFFRPPQSHGLIPWSQVKDITENSEGITIHWKNEAVPGRELDRDHLYVSKDVAQSILSAWPNAKKKDFTSASKPYSPTSSNLLFPLSVILILGGFVFLIFVSSIMWKQIESKSWPSTTAVVVSANYQKTGYTHHWMIEGTIFYDYKLHSQLFRSNRFSMWSKDYKINVSDYSPATGPYTNGMSVSIYYNPANPDESVLSPGTSAMSWLIGLPLMLLGVGITWRGVELLLKARASAKL